MNQLEFNVSFLNLKTKNNSLTVQIVFGLQNPPTFRSEERLVEEERGLLVYLYY